MFSGAILITGTSRGLGNMLAKAYLDLGMSVVGCSRQKSTIDHSRYTHFIADVSKEADVSSMVREIVSLKLPIHLLINNAGLTQSSLSVLTRAKNAEEIILTNLLGSFLVSKEVLKVMQRQRYGRIVNFSSINVPLASIGSSVYNATKAGVDVMSRVFTAECGSSDITVNTLGLSLVSGTGMVESLNIKALKVKQNCLLKPNILSLDEIIHAINFLASPLSRNISSQTIFFGGV
jgi:3-oxoacyl-[acyl-carrier protein] reductase